MNILSKPCKATNGTITVNQKNPIAIVRFGGGLEESQCDSRGVGCVSRIDEGTKAEGGARRPLPLPNERV